MNAESGIKFTQDQTVNGGSPPVPIPIPTATGTNYSYIKQLALAVTAGGGTTSLLNRRVAIAASPTLPTGIAMYFKGTGTYANDTSGNSPAGVGTNGAVPSTYSAVTTSNQVYDSSTVACGTGYPARNGEFCVLVLGVDNTFTGGAGQLALPNVLLVYDEQ